MRFLPVVHDLPPNYAEIYAAFRPDQTVMFAYAPNIYNPHRLIIPPQLHAHERVHIERQGDDPAGWWRRYLDDAGFRLAEEVYAHRAEWRAYRERHENHRKREAYLRLISGRLASGLYSGLVSPPEARRLITIDQRDVQA